MNKNLKIGLLWILLQAESSLSGSDYYSQTELDPVVQAVTVVNRSRLQRALLYAQQQAQYIADDMRSLQDQIEFSQNNKKRKDELARLAERLKIKQREYTRSSSQEKVNAELYCQALENKMQFLHDDLERNKKKQRLEQINRERESLYLIIAVRLQSDICQITGKDIVLSQRICSSPKIKRFEGLRQIEASPPSIGAFELSPPSIIGRKSSPNFCASLSELSNQSSCSSSFDKSSADKKVSAGKKKDYMNQAVCFECCQKVEKYIKEPSFLVGSSLSKVR